MKDNFDKSLAALLQPGREGGFSNNPSDPGGMTNRGVTKRVWEAWVGHPVTEDDMRSLTPLLVAPLYRRNYWDTVVGDNLPEGVDYVVFDCAVNSGAVRAIKILQKSVGVTDDGVLGIRTLTAVNSMNPIALITTYNTGRLSFMQSLANWDAFKGGWSRRIVEVTSEATLMA